MTTDSARREASMAHRSIEEEEVLVRSNAGQSPTEAADTGDAGEDGAKDDPDDDADPYLPQCKIKRNYSCNLCNFFSQNPRSFLYHSRDVHFDRIKIYECSQCLYASKHSQKLQRHINMIHVAGKTRKNKKTEKKKETKPKTVAVAVVEPAAVLPVVEMEVEEGDEETDLVEKELRCSVCNFCSTSRMLMRRHERVVHLKKRFLKCSKCSYVTHVKARYTKHVKYHSMPMIKCDLCDFRTPYKWNLDRHYKNHCGSGAFQCSKCNFRADIKQSLTVHEMNHHVPPVGQGAIMARKKNKVGASETTALESDCIDKEELELLRLEREDAASCQSQVVDGVKRKISASGTQSEPKKIMLSTQGESNGRASYNTKRESSKELQSDFIHPDDIVPRYGQIYVKNLKCKFCSYKAVFNHEIWRHEKRVHGYSRTEHKKDKPPTRPPPKLIPIQNKVTSNQSGSPILKIPNVKSKLIAPASPRSQQVAVVVNDVEFNEMCKKSCLTSSLKDFVSLIGDEDGLKNIPDPVCDIETLYKEALQDADPDAHDPSDTDVKKLQTDFLKKKNASFFDKLKEKLLTGANEECNLICEMCGHESKCLSESVAHHKKHEEEAESEEDEGEEDQEDESGTEEMMVSGAELSSTRCQHCRQRCKTSADLLNHLKVCKAFGADKTDTTDDLEEGEKAAEEYELEKRVFVWNELSHGAEDQGDVEMGDDEEEAHVGARDDDMDSGPVQVDVPKTTMTMKKVFKCPHCSFWASTASRFHVHIVGHLNKKPFECSLCMYRSNWRWDITKHIRLKSARDPRHLEAQVNMTDETGRRNYSKYNKYLTLMKVMEPHAESSGTGRRSRACDATQGTVSDDMIQPLPAPPQLTRAPTPGVPLQIPQGAPLRPPPLLKAAQQVAAPVMTSDSTKKTLWKCKKCNYRDSNKEQVLIHVKNHYGKKKRRNEGKSQCAASISQNASAVRGQMQNHGEEEGAGADTDVTEPRGSYAEVDLNLNLAESSQNSNLAPCVDDSHDVISCDVCPFTTETEDDLTAHKLNHVDRPGSIFKCTYCPFYVPSKIAVLEHMEVHGIDNADDLASLPVDNFDPSEWNDDFSSKNLLLEKRCGGSSAFGKPLSMTLSKNRRVRSTKTSQESGGCKRYRCRQCPYVSNSKTQFLYHKQFHRPRNAPFKCMYCSYNVTRRHLLHQHLRVHHLNNDTPLQEAPDMNTIDMPEIPLVWVQRAGGDIVKMFKCRWCPHVNLRKVNIQEHEKMHQDIKKEGDPPQLRLQCADCSYTCNNPGVLSSHVKVHQGLFGEIRSLVDPTRSDADQIKFLQTSSRIVEPEVVIKIEQDSDVDLKERPEPCGVEEEAQPESSYNQTNEQGPDSDDDHKNKLLNFCNKCPARFFFKKELRIHAKFHLIRLPFRCPFCTYTARQRPHLLAHYKVHSQDYQEKTAGLVDSYMVSGDCPQPKTAMIMKESPDMEGAVWMVVSQENLVGKAKDGKSTYKPLAKHACHRCPAKFFKTVALQYHLTLHGGSHQHKCKYCDYTVKTYGNLIKHQLVHEEGRLEGKQTQKTAPKTQKQEHQDGKKPKENCDNTKKADPQFGYLMHGHPDFIYPTYLKNGKIKEKRYKCHKCPSAFEKRDQYKVHLSLHGSKQKYKCEKCDYSVKYYANYVQHMRKHQLQEEAQLARKSEQLGQLHIKEEPMSPSHGHVEDMDLNLGLRLGLDLQDKKPQPYELTLVEQQTLLLQEKKKPCVDSEDKKMFWCCYCPYSSNRRDGVDSHMRRHACVSGSKAAFECPHCDYTACQGNFLREHIKVHFRGPRLKPDAYLKVERLEMWYQEDKGKEESRILVFRDHGEEMEEQDRYLPSLVEEADDEEAEWRMYVNPETGEPVVEGEDMEDLQASQAYGDLVEMVDDDLEEAVEEVEEEDLCGKARGKRIREKKWQCNKCPHAFCKKDQYLRHITLHGANQLHPCDICDYSVKFYTNYVQHMRMHQLYEPEKMGLLNKDDCGVGDDSSQGSTDYLQLEPEVIINGEDGSGWVPGVQHLDADCSSSSEGSLSDTTQLQCDGNIPQRVEAFHDVTPS